MNNKIKPHRLLLLIFLIFTSILFYNCEQNQKISVESNPDSAKVYVDGKFVGNTPTDLNVGSSSKLYLDFKEIDTNIIRSTSKESRVLTTSYIPLTANLPLFVALENNYFEKNGVTVNAI